MSVPRIIAFPPSIEVVIGRRPPSAINDERAGQFCDRPGFLPHRALYVDARPTAWRLPYMAVTCPFRLSRARGCGPSCQASINFRRGERVSVRPRFGVVFMGLAQKISPCLWFDDQGEEAAG